MVRTGKRFSSENSKNVAMKVKARPNVHDRKVDESEHRGLTPGSIYDVVGFDSQNFRVIDDIDQPLLYPKALFEKVDFLIPADWISVVRGGEYYVDPPECAEKGFYEDYFDGVESAVKKFDAFRARCMLAKKK